MQLYTYIMHFLWENEKGFLIYCLYYTCWQETLTNFEWNCKLVVTKSNLLLIVHKSALEKKLYELYTVCKRVWCNLWVIMSVDLCAYVYKDLWKKWTEHMFFWDYQKVFFLSCSSMTIYWKITDLGLLQQSQNKTWFWALQK